MMSLLVFVSALILTDPSQTTPKVVPAAEATQHVGEEVTVELVVRSSRQLESGKFCFLNSHKSFSDKANFTVSIRGDALAEFAKMGIDDPAEHYLRRKIHVRGKVTLYKEKAQVLVDSPQQIKLAEEK